MSQTVQGTSVPAVFSFESNEVRVIDRNGDPWFVASDVCKALDYAHVPHAMRMLDGDEKDVQIVDTPGGPQQNSIINESGLYSLILRSRKPEARRFKKWVTSEVLPAIRQAGAYRITSQSQANALREIFASGNFLISHQNGNLVLNPVPHGHLVVDPTDPADLNNLIFNYVPLAQLWKVIDSANGKLHQFVQRQLNKEESK